MTYTILPNSGQSLGVTRVPINTNFSLIQSVFAVNHIGFNNVGAGKHKFVVMPNQASFPTPPPTTLPGEAAIYTKQGSAGVGTSALYMIRDGNAGTEVQLSTSAVGNVIVGTTGYVWLPGGAFLQWGQVLAAPQSGQVVFLTPFDIAPFSIQVSIQRASSGQQVVIDSATPPTASTFNYLISSPTNDLYWIAIGRKI